MTHSHSSYSKAWGFTLIELLVVIAIIGILAGIIIPTVGSVRNSANKAKTKTQFSQWASAMELFKQEYGYYPDVAEEGKLDATKFLASLTGRDYLGKPLHVDLLNGNRKAISFYSIADSELAIGADGASENEIIDAFGNSDIVVVVDKNRDGRLDKSEGFERKSLKVGNVSEHTRGDASAGPINTDFPDTGIRASVAFYSAGKGASANDYVLSWK